MTLTDSPRPGPVGAPGHDDAPAPPSAPAPPLARKRRPGRTLQRPKRAGRTVTVISWVSAPDGPLVVDGVPVRSSMTVSGHWASLIACWMAFRARPGHGDPESAQVPNEPSGLHLVRTRSSGR